VGVWWGYVDGDVCRLRRLLEVCRTCCYVALQIINQIGKNPAPRRPPTKRAEPEVPQDADDTDCIESSGEDQTGTPPPSKRPCTSPVPASTGGGGAPTLPPVRPRCACPAKLPHRQCARTVDHEGEYCEHCAGPGGVPDGRCVIYTFEGVAQCCNNCTGGFSQASYMRAVGRIASGSRPSEDPLPQATIDFLDAIPDAPSAP
jgi:hypothetical protein